MTIEKAFAELIKSEEYKAVAKLQDSQGAKYRIYLKRHADKVLKTGAMVELLIAHGYTISANKAVKKNK
jgi:hypothetical protein